MINQIISIFTPVACLFSLRISSFRVSLACFVSIVLCSTPFSVLASNQTVNVYNWSNYLPHSIIKQFEKETGIHVNYTEFTSNEALYAKLSASPVSAYDVIFPSSYYVDKFIKTHRLQRLDISQLPHLKHLDSSLFKSPYAVPYLWGTTGIAVNTRYIDIRSVRHWKDLWNPRFKNQLILMNEPREVFNVALLTLGYPINDTQPEHIKAAYQKLIKLLSNVKVFTSEGLRSIYSDEEAYLGMAWGEHVAYAKRANPRLRHSLKYIYPKEGFVVWVDCIAIPKRAPHLRNAYRFINFILRPDIARRIALSIHEASPNKTAVARLPRAIRSDTSLYPTAKQLRRAQRQHTINAKALNLYQYYWQRLKFRAV